MMEEEIINEIHTGKEEISRPRVRSRRHERDE